MLFGSTHPIQSALVLILVSASPGLAHAAGGEPHPVASSTRFRINHFAYDKDGKLQAAPVSVRPAVTSLFYGEPVSNVVFSIDVPAAPGRQPTSPAPVKTPASENRKNSPSRPFRPQYRIDRWDREDGLPAIKVNALLQTRDGYLWIGTVGGLARFDGARFVIFNDVNTSEMATNGSIGRALFEGEDGCLWVGTERGMLCYSSGRFVVFTGQDEVRGYDVRCFTRRSSGGFWFGAGGRLGYWDGSAVRWLLNIESEVESSNRILSLTEGPGGTLWIGTFGGLWRADLKTGGITRIPLGGQAGAISGLLLDRDLGLWIGSGRGVWRLRRGATEPFPIGGSDPAMRTIPHAASFSEDAEGTTWATTGLGDGVFRLSDGVNGIAVTQVADELSETLCVLVDREGAVWIGARDKGLFRLRHQRFTTLAFDINSILDHIRSVTEGRDGSLWFASRAGIGNWSGREITLLDMRNLGPRRNSPIFILPSGVVRTSFPTGGLFEPPLPSNDPRFFLPVVPLFPDVGEVQAMCVRRDGNLWMGTASGLYRAKGGSGVARIEGLSSADVRALLEDQQGRFWIGTAGGGLNCVSDERVRAYTSGDGLSHDDVGALHESENGSLWIGTQTGLCHFREGRFAAFTPDSGVPQQAIHCILEDDFGRLWFSHAAGISRVARKDLEAWLLDRSRAPDVAEFGTQDGILNLESTGGSQPAGLKASDGRLWFPTRRGLVVVDPAECPTNNPPPRVLIESAAADGEALPIDASLQLSPGRGRHLDIRFTATSLHSPDRVRIRYQLEGHDSGWRDSGSLRLATYANLRPGAYAFRVQARNHEGRWSERDAVLAFRLAPHFWQTWPFYSACVLAFAGSAGGFMVWRLRQQHLRLETQRLQALEGERERIARDMHDHLGAQLAGIALASDEKEVAHRRAREALREVNDLIWSVHPGNDTLPSLADFIANFAGSYLGAAGVELDLDLPAEIPPVPIPNLLRHEVAAMFKEALRNVVQHAQAKRVIVRMEIRGDRLGLTVRDDGHGFDPPLHQNSRGRANAADIRLPATQGNGVRNFHARSESLGGNCHMRSAPGLGTEVEFIVPLNISS